MVLFRRYDGRAALPDLRPFEATPDLDLLGMTEVERQIETKCDEERYWALHHKEDQVELFRGKITRIELIVYFILIFSRGRTETLAAGT